MITAMMPMLVMFTASGGKASDGNTRALLNIVLGTVAGDQRTSNDGPCTRANNASSLRGDVIYFLSQLSSDGAITSECDEDAATKSCRLVIRQAIPNTETVWSRTYVMTIDRRTNKPKQPIECFTIP